MCPGFAIFILKNIHTSKDYHEEQKNVKKIRCRYRVDPRLINKRHVMKNKMHYKVGVVKFTIVEMKFINYVY